MSYFMDTAANIVGNTKLRAPQIEAYIKIQDYFSKNEKGEALVVLPTGTGKSGLISIAPFGVSKGRILIVTPGLVTKQSIRKTQEALEDNFWVNFDVIFNPGDLPVVSEYRADISKEHLEKSHIVYSNIHMLIEARARGLLRRVGRDFFDMIIIDEAHHAPADSWREVLSYFESAKKLHVTGTPFRGDNQEVPGEKIHETPLSEVMRDRYVKLLRKETVNAHELYFTVPDLPGKKLSKEDVLALKEREWLEKSVALSESCSKDVIQHSVLKLKQFKDASPKVPHKILAIGCSIRHAEDLYKWYKEHGLESVIVHSEMEADELEASFRAIDTHQCQVVISVNMLMEGYDHQYLSTLAIFRPYRSINAFAQVVGRVLRAIPGNEITDFEIDNNAVVIYHEEIGLNLMWKNFQNEVDRAKNQRVREYSISDAEYASRDKSLAGVDSDAAFVSDQDSYLEDVDFNALFERARTQVLNNAAANFEKIKQSLDYDEAGLEDLKKKLIEIETRRVAKDIDPNLIAKRPDQARRRMKEILSKKAQDEVASLLSDLGIDAKGTTLARSFSRYIPKLQADTPNDGVLVWYVNSKLYNRFGAIKDRDNTRLLQSIEAISAVIEELRKMLSRN